MNSFLARPYIQILVNAETRNDTHYQYVSCTANGGRPMPQISWLIGDLPPSDYPFTVDVAETLHSNGTSTLSSILSFPTHLQDQEYVTCVVKHPTLPNPKLITRKVETYGRCRFTAAHINVAVFVLLSPGRVASPVRGLQSSIMTQHLTTL